MTGVITSTVPGAVARLQAVMLGVVAANPALSAGVFVGQVVGAVPSNFLCIGDPAGKGDLIVNYRRLPLGDYSDPQMAGMETYGIGCWVRAYGDDPTQAADRIADAFTLVNGLATALSAASDTDAVLAGGSWQVGEIHNPAAGKLDGRGWGFVLAFTVEVQDVVLQPT